MAHVLRDSIEITPFVKTIEKLFEEIPEQDWDIQRHSETNCGKGLYRLDLYGESTFVDSVPSICTQNYIKNGCLYAKDGWVLDLESGKTSKYIWGEWGMKYSLLDS